ncbi:hypothetical protein CHS0354_027291 [Potamilus streckersoni]|uniref:Cathepsin propeptide inhibitor domain-containing protein n=1 Tax=Potamilus streckersoni TaxID=2493646 RepID=A0AAE0W8Q8_9BIVA|nr:hypothetical protein CHS0354_027291 [Potamilus streckersoni]
MRYETIVTFVVAASWMPASPGNMKFVRQFEIKPANDIHGNVIASWWKMFKAKYGQQYATKDEDAYRRSVFPENIKTFELHNQKFKKGNTSFWMGLNKYSDLNVNTLDYNSDLNKAGGFSFKPKSLTGEMTSVYSYDKALTSLEVGNINIQNPVLTSVHMQLFTERR